MGHNRSGIVSEFNKTAGKITIIISPERRAGKLCSRGIQSHNSRDFIIFWSYFAVTIEQLPVARQLISQRRHGHFEKMLKTHALDIGGRSLE
jgi:Trk K+ transport system NAD-binding subunit